jgi:hypothetical protein
MSRYAALMLNCNAMARRFRAIADTHAAWADHARRMAAAIIAGEYL